MKTYDVVVLGGGSAGTSAARTAHRLGAEVVLFNDGELGGLCILRGCMPTKTMLHAAHVVHEARHARVPGVKTKGADVHFAEIMANKDAKVARFKRAKIAGIERDGYEVVDARARFIGPDAVEAGGETYRFRKGAVIATGSVPHVPPIEGLDQVPYVTSDDVMRMTERPRSMAVLGSGAIGLELAQFFSRLGTHVHLFSRRPVGARVDPDVAREYERALRDEPHFDLHQPEVPRRVARVPAGVRIEFGPDEEHGESIEVEALLVATGREIALAGLGLDAAGVEVTRGRIPHGPDMRTNRPNVFVAGDATGEHQLLHVANQEGAVAARNAVDPAGSQRVDMRLLMTVIFTDPPLATLGMSEGEARANGHDVRVSIAHLPETGRAITMEVRHGISKLVADAATGEILGAQILGPRADDVIHVLSAVMYYRGTASQMLDMPWYHPTLSEVLLSQARELAV